MADNKLLSFVYLPYLRRTLSAFLSILSLIFSLTSLYRMNNLHDVVMIGNNHNIMYFLAQGITRFIKFIIKYAS